MTNSTNTIQNELAAAKKDEEGERVEVPGICKQVTDRYNDDDC